MVGLFNVTYWIFSIYPFSLGWRAAVQVSQLSPRATVRCASCSKNNSANSFQHLTHLPPVLPVHSLPFLTSLTRICFIIQRSSSSGDHAPTWTWPPWAPVGLTVPLRPPEPAEVPPDLPALQTEGGHTSTIYYTPTCAFHVFVYTRKCFPCDKDTLPLKSLGSPWKLNL